MNSKLFLVSAAACAIMMACSSDDGESVSAPKQDSEKSSSSSNVVDSLEDLPNCTLKREGKTFYVKEEKADFVCVDGDWLEAEEEESICEEDEDDCEEVSSSSRRSSSSVKSSSSSRRSSLDDDVDEEECDENYDDCEEVSSSSKRSSSSGKDVSSSSTKRSSSSLKNEGTMEYTLDVGKFVMVDKRDGESYRVAIVGGKVWTAENNRYETKVTIPEETCSYKIEEDPVDCDSELKDGSGFDIETGEKYCYRMLFSYDHCKQVPAEMIAGGSAGSLDTDGRLYSWKAVQKACPAGWHVPTENDWNDLFVAAHLDDVLKKSSCGLCSEGRCNSKLQVDPRGNSVCNYDAILSEKYMGTDELGVSLDLVGIFYGGDDYVFYDYGKDATYWSSTGRSLQRDDMSTCEHPSGYSMRFAKDEVVDGYGLRLYAKGAGVCYDVVAGFFPTRCVKD